MHTSGIAIRGVCLPDRVFPATLPDSFGLRPYFALPQWWDVPLRTLAAAGFWTGGCGYLVAADAVPGLGLCAMT